MYKIADKKDVSNHKDQEAASTMSKTIINQEEKQKISSTKFKIKSTASTTK